MLDISTELRNIDERQVELAIKGPYIEDNESD
jgi:hypothetical protein